MIRSIHDEDIVYINVYYMNRLVGPESPYLRPCSAPRCRLITSWGWRSSQGYGCSPFKVVRELGSDRQIGGTRTVMLSEKNQLISVKPFYT